MSPILVRPVREQFEHDRVIRVLQSKYKRKYEVAINPGAEQNTSVTIGDLPMFPDLVLFESERSRKVYGTVEVETTESINTLEAMAEWGPFGRLRAAFFLYVPASSIDTVRRLCAEHNIHPSEIWTFHAAIDQVRFTMVQRTPESQRPTDGRPVRAQRLVETPPVRPPEARPAREAEPQPERPPAAPSEPVARGARPQPAPAGAARKSAPPARAATKSIGEKKPVPPPPSPAKPAPSRSAKPAKKLTAAKKPRAVAARLRPAAKKTVKSATAKRSVASKR